MARSKKNNSVAAKKPFWKKWWFWVVVVVVLAMAFGSNGNKQESTTNQQSSTSSSVAEQKKESSDSDKKAEQKSSDKQTYDDSDLKTAYYQCKDEFAYPDLSISLKNGNRGSADSLWMHPSLPVSNDKGFSCISGYFGLNDDLKKDIDDSSTSEDEHTLDYKNLHIIYHGRIDPTTNKPSEPEVIITHN
ncbi:hypothetical protein [Bifidobacterium scaligerum]|uniref:Uncharacterized protein n=1 Tax=Bifidobacterium scaligerum TaxID=2052656 RepID=A0A2M9HNZ9_9BIFI|nr:hypothetical protein [Bifidobacterium scaligerum]PJM78548.1 hypothetical protein CUU80_08875 [Bifidobacterium scaligerum]